MGIRSSFLYVNRSNVFFFCSFLFGYTKCKSGCNESILMNVMECTTHWWWKDREAKWICVLFFGFLFFFCFFFYSKNGMKVWSWSLCILHILLDASYLTSLLEMRSSDKIERVWYLLHWNRLFPRPHDVCISSAVFMHSHSTTEWLRVNII